MTVTEAINAVVAQRPGCCLSNEEYTEKLCRLEEDIYCNIISEYEGAVEFSNELLDNTELLAEDMYAELYIFYLIAATDLTNGDITRYSNNMILYNNLMSEYADWYNRNHTREKKTRIGWC